jgi:NTE family protein
MKLNPTKLDNNISELYSLGYFRIIYYEIIKTENEKIDLVINIHESQLKKFNLGLKWDNYYDLIAIANIQLNSRLFPGFRIEDQFYFAGVKKNIFSIYYPSKKLNFPIYPFIRIKNSENIFKKYDFDNKPKRYRQKINGISTGIGLLLKNYWNTEFEYYYRQESFFPEENDVDKYDIYASISLSAQLDLLDDILLPWNGIYIEGKYENSSSEWGSTQNYHFYRGFGDIYFSKKRNTYRLMGYYHQTLNDAPRYIKTIPSGSQIFTGVKEFQLWGNTLVFSRLEYRYKHKKDIFAHLIMSWLISAKVDENFAAENKWSIGVGITLISPLGPMEFIWSRGPKNIYLIEKGWQNLFYFSTGYKF